LASGNFLDLCRHLLGRLSVYSLAPSGNKGPTLEEMRSLSALNGIPAKRNANTASVLPAFAESLAGARAFFEHPAG